VLTLLSALTLCPALAGEPPLLADLVASGKLPPEAERLPSWQVGLSDIVKRPLVTKGFGRKRRSMGNGP
jgi:hypothetical protein